MNHTQISSAMHNMMTDVIDLDARYLPSSHNVARQARDMRSLFCDTSPLTAAKDIARVMGNSSGHR